MYIAREVSTNLFHYVLFFNILFCVPQLVLLFKRKTACDTSLFSFSINFLLQLVMLAYAITNFIFFLEQAVGVVISGLLVALIYKYKFSTNINNITLEEIFEQLPGHVYWKDKNGICYNCNTNNHKDFGLNSIADYKGKTDHDLFLKEEADHIRLIDEEVMREDKLKIAEEKTTINGKEYLYLSYKVPLKNKKGKIIGIIGNSVDVTKIKKTTTEQLDVLDNIISVMPGNVYWINREGIYQGCNNNQAAVIGLTSRSDIIGKRNINIPGFLIPEVLDKVNEQVMQTRQAITVEEPAIFPDGIKGTFLSNKVPLYNRDNEVIGMVGISIDITERKRSEEELKQAKKKAEIANNTKTEFLQNMRHDFRTPFAGMLGMASILYQAEEIPEKKEQLKHIVNSAHALLEQLNEITDFITIEDQGLSIEEKQFDFQKMMLDLKHMLLPPAQEKELQFSIEIDKKIPKYMLGDRLRTQRILMNLLANSIKFTKIGQVSLQVTIGKIEGVNIVLKYTIKDTGIGMSKEEQEFIFEKFARLTPTYKGIYSGKGLGLKIVKQFVTELNGEIHLTSSPNQGTTFIILIPYKLPLLNCDENNLFIR